MRRRRHRHYALAGKYSSPEKRFAQKMTGQWLVRLLECQVPMDDKYFECLQWVLGDLHGLLDQLKASLPQHVTPGRVRKIKAYIEENIDEDDNEISSEFADVLDTFPVVEAPLQKLVAEACPATPEQKGFAPCETAKKNLHKFFGLSAAAGAFCEFVYLQSNYHALEEYFEDSLELYKTRNRDLLAKMLDIPTQKLRDIIQDCCDMRILERGGHADNYFRLESAVQPLWSDIDAKQAQNLFCVPAKGETLPIRDFQIGEEDLWEVRQLLQNTGKDSVHILLYGAPGTGKTTFARSLVKELGISAYAVSNCEGDDDGDRRSCLVAGANLVSKKRNTILIADEAEHLLATGGFFMDNPRDKAWLNAFLETPGRRIIWIVNDIDHVHEAVLRRFTFSIQFEALSLEQRNRAFLQILDKQRMRKHLSEKQIDTLVRTHDDASIAAFDMAVKRSRSIVKDKKDFFKSVNRLLEANVVLTHYGHRKARVHAVEDYTLDGACIKGSAHELVADCIRADAAIRNGKELRPGAATMLFYGPPGTGKTALARHIADTIKRECVVKKASDLLGSYVGESERKIAAAFETAQRKGQVLVIDEADSFIYTRDMVSRSWEGTQVNEFLTQLEECRCFCICTTNRRSQLDEASMRRFAHKVEFTFATPTQLVALYQKTLAPLCPDEMMSEEHMHRLMAMQKLAPGDFHAVQGQFGSIFKAPENVSHDILLAALERESGLKLGQKSVGFTA